MHWELVQTPREAARRGACWELWCPRVEAADVTCGLGFPGLPDLAQPPDGSKDTPGGGKLPGFAAPFVARGKKAKWEQNSTVQTGQQEVFPLSFCNAKKCKGGSCS